MGMNIMRAAAYLDGLIYAEHTEKMQAMEQRRKILNQIYVQRSTLQGYTDK